MICLILNFKHGEWINYNKLSLPSCVMICPPTVEFVLCCGVILWRVKLERIFWNFYGKIMAFLRQNLKILFLKDLWSEFFSLKTCKTEIKLNSETPFLGQAIHWSRKYFMQTSQIRLKLPPVDGTRRRYFLILDLASCSLLSPAVIRRLFPTFSFVFFSMELEIVFCFNFPFCVTKATSIF